MKRNTVKRNVSLALGAVLVFGAVPAYGCCNGKPERQSDGV